MRCVHLYVNLKGTMGGFCFWGSILGGGCWLFTQRTQSYTGVPLTILRLVLFQVGNHAEVAGEAAG